MLKATKHRFGQVIQERRGQLNLTQEEVARRIKVSAPYIGHLEAGLRYPSEKMVTKLANVLGLDRREAFLLANPSVKALLSQPARVPAASAWDQFRKDEPLLRVYNVSLDEMETLSYLALMGEVRSSHDFVYVLSTIRLALGR